MRISFKQGILNHESDNVGSQLFLTEDSGKISIIVVDTPTVITASDGNINYLFNESTSVLNAWTDTFTAPNDYWLYWDIDRITGIRTFGSTALAPVYGPTAPTVPATDQHWFDTTNNTHKVYDGSVWVKYIRVFAAKFEGSATLKTVADPATNGFIGTQIQQTGSYEAGYLVFDSNGKAIKKQDGTFYNTNTDFITQIPDGSRVKLESILIEGLAQTSIPAYRAVQFTSFNKIIAASTNTADDVVFGVIDVSVGTGDVVKVIMEGIIQNSGWNWSGVNKFVYANANGLIEETFSVAEQLPIGVTIDSDKILLRAPRILLESGLRVNATDASKGIVRLSATPIDQYDPIAVGDNDIRLTDTRDPNAHVHAIDDTTNLQSTLDAKLDVVGGTMTGPIVLSGAPTLATHAANKQYVDDQFADVNGDTFLGDIDMNANSIVNLAAPVNTGDAVNKTYVDSNFLDISSPSALAANIDMNSLYSVVNLIDPVNAGDAVSKSYADTNYIESAGDTMSGDLTLSNLPTLAGHATRKSYVDDNFINEDGSNPMTGELTLVGSPVNSLHAVHKQYVDDNFINVTGDAMSGVLDLGMNAITNLANPVNAQDAVTKAFADASYLNSVGDTMAGILSLGNNRITMIATPVDPQDAINKQYVEGNFVDLSGSTMTGLLALSGDPVGNFDATTKQYVDTNFLSVTTPNPMASDFNLNGNLIINLGDPISPQDAVTRSYGDANYINTTGDTMTGTLVLNIAPSGPNDAVRKSYVDNGFINTNGTVGMLASLDMQSNSIINIANPISSNDAVNLGYANANYIPASGANMTGYLTLFGDPINVNHAATKSYVDSNFLNTSGGTMTGFLTLNSDPSAALHAATKQYVDASFLNVTGDGMTGTLDMNSNSIIELPLVPTNASDAASKSYVDQHVLKSGSVMTGGLNMNLQPLTNIAPPVLSTDAVNKSYVDNKVDVTGDVMSGTLDMNGNAIINLATPVNSADVATKGYIDSGFVQLVGDTMTGDLNMANVQRVVNLPAPSTGTDAVNKTYVDSNFVTTTGDTMTGFLILNGNPSNVLGAVPKQYVDANFLLSAGDTMSGNLSMGGANTVTNLTVPVNASDAATKSFVEGLMGGFVADTGHVWVGPGTLDMSGIAIQNVPLVPSAAGEVASKQYVDARLVSAGDTMTGDLSMANASRVTDLLDPSAAQDAATKQYVDDQVSVIPTIYDIAGSISGQPKIASASSHAAFFGLAKVGVDATGLLNDATIYTASVAVDGVANAITITGSAAQTFTALLVELNTDLIGAIASIVSGGIVIESGTTGTTSSIIITDTDLFSTLTDFHSFNIPIVGDTRILWQTVMIRSCTIDPTSGADTAFVAGTPSVDGTVSLEMRKNGAAPFGTIAFNVGSNIGTPTLTTATTFVIGDILTIENAEVSIDSELADVGFMISGEY